MRAFVSALFGLTLISAGNAARGAFNNAPELIGFNIRKGRCDSALPDTTLQLLETIQ